MSDFSDGSYSNTVESDVGDDGDGAVKTTYRR